MPTYEYRCKGCGRHLEVVQAFTDDALTSCDDCGGVLRKVFGSVGISFKGSGFYKTDSRSSSPAASGSSDKGSSDKGSSDKGSPDKGSTDKGSTDTGSTDTGSSDKASTSADSASATRSTASTPASTRS